MDNMNSMIALFIIADYFHDAAKRREQRALRDAGNQPSDARQESLLSRIVRRLRAAAAPQTPRASGAGRAPAF